VTFLLSQVIDGARDVVTIHEELINDAKVLCKEIGSKPLNVFEEGELI